MTFNSASGNGALFFYLSFRQQQQSIIYKNAVIAVKPVFAFEIEWKKWTWLVLSHIINTRQRSEYANRKSFNILDGICTGARFVPISMDGKKASIWNAQYYYSKVFERIPKSVFGSIRKCKISIFSALFI